MKLVDTHCHLHDQKYDWAGDEIDRAWAAGVDRIITVGTDVDDSRRAMEFAAAHDGVFAVIGIHPGIDFHGSDPYTTEKELEEIYGSDPRNVVGLGDIGLDYHYKPYDRGQQTKLFEMQLELAAKYDLPVSFHVREAFDDFWSILDNFRGLRGTLHSYTDNLENMEKALSRGLYISVNGIVTFNKEPELSKVFDKVPLDRLLLETDAPYLAPVPYRGKPNQPAYVREIAEFLAAKRGTDADELAEITTKNAEQLFFVQILRQA